MTSQVNHQWFDWNEMADDYLRMVNEADGSDDPTQEFRVIAEVPGQRMVTHILEFAEPLPATVLPRGKMAQSMAGFALPHLHYPRWNLGHRLIVKRTVGLKHWLKVSMVAPMTAISTNKLIYLTTPDPGDRALIKMRCQEYTGE